MRVAPEIDRKSSSTIYGIMSSEAATTISDGGASHDVPTSEPQEIEKEPMVAATSTHHGNSVDPKPKSRRNKKKIKIKHLEKKLKILDKQIKKYIHSQ